MVEEKLVGGLESAKLRKGLLSLGGYGIFVTSKRIIGVKARGRFILRLFFEGLGAAFGNVPGALGLAGAFLSSLLADKLSASQQAKLIEELDEKKDFELGKGDVAELELRKPGIIRGLGHLLIRSSSGEKVKILIDADAKKEYECLKELLIAFKPEVLKLV
ncbi:MAG TPA: hypothetical protein ENF78_05975 [Candidatus Bathyarchaeota archaeon]|nr:hypothetical protein [Candidatus Bathyarchaeota archaeon]